MNDDFFVNVCLSPEGIDFSIEDVKKFLRSGGITLTGVGAYLLKLQLPAWLYVFFGVLAFASFVIYTWINAPEHFWKSYDKRHKK